MARHKIQLWRRMVDVDVEKDDSGEVVDGGGPKVKKG